MHVPFLGTSSGVPGIGWVCVDRGLSSRKLVYLIRVLGGVELTCLETILSLNGYCCFVSRILFFCSKHRCQLTHWLSSSSLQPAHPEHTFQTRLQRRMTTLPRPPVYEIKFIGQEYHTSLSLSISILITGFHGPRESKTNQWLLLRVIRDYLRKSGGAKTDRSQL